jgi:hypothetical protein
MTTSRLSSWLLLLGILAGFLGAAWQGRLAAGYSKPDNFRRFHQRISPDASFYPPYAMLETLALARWSPGKTLVIIGGNSILNGVGQPAGDVWSQHLQAQLGDAYVVVNLALRGAAAAQGAALVAESLLRRGLPVIYVANGYPLSGSGQAPGGPYGYYYWQAFYAGRLSTYPARDDHIARWLASLPPKEREQQAEERLGSRLDAALHQQSLWHHVGYRHFFTVWSFILAQDSFLPRSRLRDNEPKAPPVAARFQAPLPEEMAAVRSFTENLFLPDTTTPDPATLRRLGEDIDAAFVPALRPHMLMLLDESAVYYLDRLTPPERERNRLAYRTIAQLWRDRGITCAVTGEGFTPADYVDRNHLSGDGGAKLAAFVAPQILQLNRP